MDKNKKVVSVELEKEIVDSIQQHAKENYRTVSAQLRLIISEWVESHKG